MPDKSKGSQSQVQAGDHKFRIDGKVASIYSGAVHYWRLDRGKWDDILEKVKGMGFTTISTYIPWEVHEIKKGQFDFGQINPSNDIDAFLSLIEAKGMKVIARPGPQINSELTWFGYPRRILEDPELQAKTAMGSKAVLTQAPRPIPALSYASNKFFEETASWYDAICPILAKHKHPDGGLVAVQVDNEMAFFFHVNPYECDYSDASIRGYQTFLEAKYENLAKVNKIYASVYKSFSEIDPPRRFEGDKKEDIPYYTDWIEYRERYLVDSLSRLANMMKDRGLIGIPMFHNYPHPLGPGGAASGITTPFNLLALEEKLDFVGFDIYSRKELYEHVKTVVSYVVGTSRFPFIPEFIAGVWPWYLNPGGYEDEEFVTKAALMNGIKGSSRYMIVERDRWFGSPVRRDGRIRKENYETFQRINAMALRHEFVKNERKADVLLLANREYDRLEAASVLVTFPGDFLEILLGFSEYPNFMTVSENNLGFAEPIQLAKSSWFSKMYQSLMGSGYQFLLSDTSLPPERLKQYRALILGSFEYMNVGLQKKILEYAKAGGNVVVGPRIPSLDEHMQANNVLISFLNEKKRKELRLGGKLVGNEYAVNQGKVIHLLNLDQPTEALEMALGNLPLLRVIKNDPRFDVTVHSSPGKSNLLTLFAANPTAQMIDARVQLNGPIKSVLDIWEEKEIRPSKQAFTDQLPPYTIKIYEVTL